MLKEAKVFWFNNEKGYGFIRDNITNEDVFTHFAVIEREGFKHLQEGESVFYQQTQGVRGPQASLVIPESYMNTYLEEHPEFKELLKNNPKFAELEKILDKPKSMELKDIIEELEIIENELSKSKGTLFENIINQKVDEKLEQIEHLVGDKVVKSLNKFIKEELEQYKNELDLFVKELYISDVEGEDILLHFKNKNNEKYGIYVPYLDYGLKLTMHIKGFEDGWEQIDNNQYEIDLYKGVTKNKETIKEIVLRLFEVSYKI